MEPRARDRMSVPPVAVTPTTRIWAALAIMRQQAIRHLVVLDDDDRLAGVLSNRDYRKLLERLGPDGHLVHGEAITVAEIMTPSAAVITVPPDAPITEVAQLIVSNKVGCIPVVAGDRVLGVLAQKDVMRALLELRPP